MPFLPPNQQCQSTEGTTYYLTNSVKTLKEAQSTNTSQRLSLVFFSHVAQQKQICKYPQGVLLVGDYHSADCSGLQLDWFHVDLIILQYTNRTSYLAGQVEPPMCPKSPLEPTDSHTRVMWLSLAFGLVYPVLNCMLGRVLLSLHWLSSTIAHFPWPSAVLLSSF